MSWKMFAKEVFRDYPNWAYGTSVVCNICGNCCEAWQFSRDGNIRHISIKEVNDWIRHYDKNHPLEYDCMRSQGKV